MKTSTIETLKNIIDMVKSNKEISLVIVNSKYGHNILADGVYTRIDQEYGMQMQCKIWYNTPIVFSKFVDDWYIITKCNWYEQDIEGIGQLAISEEL
jgi:hypothetical protein